MKSVLISFAGSNDFNKENDGAILTIFKDKKMKFDRVILLWNPSKFSNFFEIAEYVKSALIKRNHCKEVLVNAFECEDVTDHNEIYPKLLEFCNSLNKKDKYTAAIASGTPSMQACWILLAESGDFPIRLIRSDDPKFGKPIVREVKLGTSLPKIMRLEKENKKLKKDFLPNVILNVSKAELKIGDSKVNLSPTEFSYYRFFLERAVNGSEYLRVGIYETPLEFYKSVLQYHRDSFPNSDAIRMDLEKSKGIVSATFRSNISKLNKKISTAIKDRSLSRYFTVESEGERHRKSYGINLDCQKIKILGSKK